MPQGGTVADVVRVLEVARRLDISRSHAYRLISCGVIPSVRIGRSLRVPVAAFERWVREHTSTSEGPADVS